MNEKIFYYGLLELGISILLRFCVSDCDWIPVPKLEEQSLYRFYLDSTTCNIVLGNFLVRIHPDSIPILPLSIPILTQFHFDYALPNAIQFRF